MNFQHQKEMKGKIKYIQEALITCVIMNIFRRSSKTCVHNRISDFSEQTRSVSVKIFILHYFSNFTRPDLFLRVVSRCFKINQIWPKLFPNGLCNIIQGQFLEFYTFSSRRRL